MTEESDLGVARAKRCILTHGLVENKVEKKGENKVENEVQKRSPKKASKKAVDITKPSFGTISGLGAMKSDPNHRELSLWTPPN